MAGLSVALNDGSRMPWLAFGSGTSLREKDASKQISNAIKAGFVHIDCAQMYANEESVGTGIAQSGVPRSSLYLTTKLDKLAAGQTVKDALIASLAKLKTDYVDLFLIHVPIVHEDIQATWTQMERCRLEGLTRSIGVSNFQTKHLEEILRVAVIPPAVNQIEFHPYVFKANKPLVKYMMDHNVVAASFGGLTPIARVEGGPLDPILGRIAKRLSKNRTTTVTEGQVLQIWLRKKGIPCITTTSNANRMLEYLDVVNVPNITEREEQEIDDVGSTVHHRFVCTWIDRIDSENST